MQWITDRRTVIWLPPLDIPVLDGFDVYSPRLDGLVVAAGDGRDVGQPAALQNERIYACKNSDCRLKHVESRCNIHIAPTCGKSEKWAASKTDTGARTAPNPTTRTSFLGTDCMMGFEGIRKGRGDQIRRGQRISRNR